jgi:signal transduction histidine kinase
MTPSFKRKLYLGSGASALVLIVITILSILNIRTLLIRADWVNHTNEVLLSLENIISGLKDAETGQRGYLITHNPDYLEPYIGSYYQVFSDFNKVKVLTADNVKQQQRLDKLKLLITRRFQIINNIVEKQRAGNSATAIQLVIEGKGKKTMDSVRTLISEMKREELDLRKERFEKVKTSSYITPVLMLVSSILSLFICGVFFIYLRRDAIKRFVAEQDLLRLNYQLEESNEELRTKEEQLRGINIRLEEIAEERTREIRRRIDELERINTDLDNFVYSASHDIKAPALNIEALTMALSQELSPDENSEVSDMIRMIRISVDKLRMTVSQLEKVGQIKSTQNKENINTREITEEILTAFQAQIQEASAEIILDIQTRQINFSPYQFSTILINLLSNALKFRSPERKPSIKITYTTVSDHFLMVIKDNGIGFDTLQIKKVFGLFRRAHNVEGSGVGLYIVKRIAEESGGKVEVESQPGTGTTFYVYLKTA